MMFSSFKLCPTHFSRWARIFAGEIHSPWLRTCLEHRGNMTEYSFYNCIRYRNAKIRQSICRNQQVVCKDSSCAANHRRSQGGPGCHAPRDIFSIYCHFVLWKAASQTKYCYSPKIKHFGPPKNLGWLRHCCQCRNKIWIFSAANAKT